MWVLVLRNILLSTALPQSNCNEKATTAFKVAGLGERGVERHCRAGAERRGEARRSHLREAPMTARIIRLDQFNVGCRHHANGVRFPHIYRVAGFEFDLVSEELVPGTTTPVEPFYTLSDQGNFGVANPTFVPIKALSPEADKGWIIVRHHASQARAEAYIDCIGDSRPIPYDYSGPMLWQTGEGIFTPMHRPPMPGGRTMS